MIIIYMGMSQNTVSNPGSLTRGYDSWVWFGVWFVGMIRGYDSRTLIQCFPASSAYSYLPTLTPKMFQLLVIIPYVERSGAGMLLTLCVLLSEWCARFGPGIVVPLECRCKVLVQGLAVKVVCTVWSDAGGAQGAAAGAAWGWCLKVLLSEWCVL